MLVSPTQSWRSLSPADIIDGRAGPGFDAAVAFLCRLEAIHGHIFEIARFSLFEKEFNIVAQSALIAFQGPPLTGR